MILKNKKICFYFIKKLNLYLFFSFLTNTREMFKTNIRKIIKNTKNE